MATDNEGKGSTPEEPARETPGDESPESTAPETRRPRARKSRAADDPAQDDGAPAPRRRKRAAASDGPKDPETAGRTGASRRPGERARKRETAPDGEEAGRPAASKRRSPRRRSGSGDADPGEATGARNAGRRRRGDAEEAAGGGRGDAEEAAGGGRGDAEEAAGGGRGDEPQGGPRVRRVRAKTEAETEAEAEALAAALGDDGEEEDDLEEIDAPAPEGPVFEGPVPIDTAEQRRDAMEVAGRRLGIQQLHAEQREVIDAVLSERDVLMVLPTGFGKSACYQIPSMILPKPVVVISPLLALMQDQYDKLQKRNVPCVRLDGTIRGGARREALKRIVSGERLLVMTTPETLGAPDAAEALGKSGLSMAAVDEAHCISEWGFDFRPAYLQIGERLRALGAPPVLALTATATEKVRLAIQRFVGMRDPRIVASSPHRENLAFDVLHCGGGARHRALARLALRVRRPGIIYCSTTREVDELFAILQRFGIPSHRYHGKMTAAERRKNQDQFMHRGRRTVMVATNAFGLGIDKADIRYVMHYQSPASLEQYVQEAGRAGRDGRRANCIMLFSHEDRAVHEALLSRSRVRPEQLYRLGKALAAWAGEDKVPSLQALALSAELGARTTGALLALLEEAELVRWDQTAVFVTVPPDEIEPRSRELAGQFETLRTQDARRLDAVAEYAYTEGCRAVFLREYFGESGGEDCGMCDRCRGQEDRPSSFWQPLAPPKGETARRGRGRGRSSGRPGRRSRDGERGRPGPQRGGKRSRRRGRTGRRGERSEGEPAARGARRGRRTEAGPGGARGERPEGEAAARGRANPAGGGTEEAGGRGRPRRRRGRRGSRGRHRGRPRGGGDGRPSGGPDGGSGASD